MTAPGSQADRGDAVARPKPKAPTWATIKRTLASSEHSDLLALIGALYEASPDNRAFIGARLGVGKDPLGPYREQISRWAYPDVVRGQQPSIQKARRAIAEYRKATGDEHGTAELLVWCCEEASGFVVHVWTDDEPFLNGLVRAFEDAVSAVAALRPKERAALATRLRTVMARCRDVGYGVDSSIAEAWERSNLSPRRPRQ